MYAVTLGNDRVFCVSRKEARAAGAVAKHVTLYSTARFCPVAPDWSMELSRAARVDAHIHALHATPTIMGFLDVSESLLLLSLPTDWKRGGVFIYLQYVYYPLGFLYVGSSTRTVQVCLACLSRSCLIPQPDT